MPPLLSDTEREYMESVIRMVALTFTIVLWLVAFLTVTAVVFWIVILAAAFG